MQPGAKVSSSVWNGPDKNFGVTVVGGTINRNMQLPAPPPEAAGMFRCDRSGLIESFFQQAGLKNTSETEVQGQLKWGTADVYWNMMTEVAAPFVAALGKADEAMKQKIKSEVHQQLDEKYPDGNVMINSSSWVIYGEK